MPLQPFDPRTLRLLEFPKVLERIADRAASEPGRARIRALTPVADGDTVRRRRDLLTEAMDLAAGDRMYPLDPFPDLVDIFRRLAPEGAVVSGEELRAVQACIRCGARVRSAIERDESPLPRLRELAAGLQPPLDLADELDRCIGEAGEVLDRASRELAAVRRRLRRAEADLQARLQRMLQRTDLAPLLQDRFVTVRNGRHVLPVRADGASRLPGVTHDRSDSGRTVFVEPIETLPLGNELNDLASQERVEVRRVLAALSTATRDRIDPIRATSYTLAEFDALQAAARFADAHAMVPPRFTDEPATLVLRHARHPILEQTLAAEGRAGDLVPLDLEIGRRSRVLLVSGSNTGGKTVALKAAGLLIAMAQAGLPVPVADGSEFGLFRGIYADIGDEQSIEQSLSTFSAHVANIISVLHAAAADSLVLLDELGAGTDPAEGGALACAILSGLRDRGAVTFASTHLGQPKAFVHRADGMTNAAVAFDPDSLRPTFRLELGRPGSSHALAISARLGMPGDVMDVARDTVESEEARLESLLADLNTGQRDLDDRLRHAETAREQADRDRETAREQLDGIRNRRKKILREAYREAGNIVDRTRRQMDAALRDARRVAADTGDRERVRDARRRVERKRETVADAFERTRPARPRPLPFDQIEPGQTVWVASLESEGRVEAVDERKKRVRVAVGNLTVNLAASEILLPPDRPAEPAGGAPADAAAAIPTAGGWSAETAEPTGLELNLIGQRVEPALLELDRYLNEAVVARLGIVRIVHGMGTGALRAAVHETLRSHPLVAGFRICPPEQGGYGATQVELRE